MLKENKPLIICRDVAIAYDGLTAAEGISFSVFEGDYICITGENGSGKSTLLKGILGLHPLRSGKIEYPDITKKEIGYLPQQTSVQRDFPASVYEVVISGCLGKRGLRPYYNESEKALALSNMERLGISSLKNRSYRELSGGQQQRVMLARALCASEKMLLLDEPLTGLDPVVTAELYAIIKKLNDDGVTIIMVSHDAIGAVREAKKILHLETSMKFFGTVDEYLTSDIGKRFLGR